ncbi:hypothetical protein [Glutamicibacter arilaitensis]|uniref:hypothetical protein n=1 Tax=Glutamicibacter arilaitensis TaxID=256701 RepID=UPI00384B3F48
MSTIMLSAAGAVLSMTALVPATAAPPEITTSAWMGAEAAHVGELEGFAGNAQLIGFFARTTGSGDAAVTSFNCPEGTPPSWDPESGCEVLETVGMYGYDLDVEISRNLSAGTLSGTVRVYEGETESGEPIFGQAYQLEVSMAGEGGIIKSHDKQEGSKHWSKERSATVVSGSLGAMDLTGAKGQLVHQQDRYSFN